MRKYHREWRREQKAKERADKVVDDKSIQCRICDQVIGAKGVPTHLRMHVFPKKITSKNILMILENLDGNCVTFVIR